MTRGFWGGVMLVSVLIIGVAGWTISKRLNEKKTVEVPFVKQVDNTESAPTPIPSLELPKEPITAATEMIDSEKRRILFSLKSTSAKKVFVVGSFNKWFRQPMAKKDNIWSFTVELDPGIYEYKFVVDNKRIKDPNNKTVSKAGNSVLVVKPASAT